MSGQREGSQFLEFRKTLPLPLICLLKLGFDDAAGEQRVNAAAKPMVLCGID